MNTDIIVVDEFYTNPIEVRKFALIQDFNVLGNYPGFRSKSLLTESTRNTIQNIIFPHGGQIIDWKVDNGGYTGAYQYCTANDSTWIHADIYNIWSGVCYLSPEAPLNSGTAFYMHKQTYQRYYTDNFFDGSNYDDWEQTDYVANVFNRLVLFKGCMFHASKNYFGSNKLDSRLIQTFFFDTEY